MKKTFKKSSHLQSHSRDQYQKSNIQYAGVVSAVESMRGKQENRKLRQWNWRIVQEWKRKWEKKRESPLNVL